MKEYIYLAAFGLGMLFLWLSGHTGISIAASHPGINYVVNFLISGVVYGLGAALVVYFANGRKLLPALLSGVAAAVLAPLLAFAIGNLAKGHINSKRDLGIFTFALYLIYGALYPALMAICLKLTRPRNFDGKSDSVHNS